MLTLEQGTELVKYARDSINDYLSGNVCKIEDFLFAREKQGVFVTILTYPLTELRGCIGFPEPVFSLNKAISKAAISAAVDDPRFLKLSLAELNDVAVEISVLTVPEKIALSGSEKYEDKITIGKDGLIIRRGNDSGLLLPQVPVDFGWDKKQFLAQVCVKAGLNPDAYLLDDVELYRFCAQIFSEESPNGAVVEKRL
ncbi:MAG: TIGR00296 family protein [Nanohaloarchaea archaeon]|nr:TIGR00296 family protein [Candidatus Nanohaloarchaea archaeon]